MSMPSPYGRPLVTSCWLKHVIIFVFFYLNMPGELEALQNAGLHAQACRIFITGIHVVPLVT